MALRDPRLQALRRHRVPAWWRDAKLGIFVHWAPASVPAFAPVDVDIGDLVQSDRPDALADTPYAEWYGNSLRFPDSAVSRHHRDVYGDRPYEAFAEDWEAGLAGWDPEDWARRFAATGARWVVMVTKHMDGYCLWPTEVTNPHRSGWYSRRDVVGELREAVLGAGMRFGVYYSGGLDATFNDHPMGSVADMMAAVPRGAYPAYADAQVRELIARYSPSVLWNDIAWPSEGKALWPLLEHYYDQVPDGVVNDRWMPWNPILAAAHSPRVRKLLDAGARRQARKDGGIVPPRPPHADYRTPEYVSFPDVQAEPFECVRGMDHSFGYNARSRPEDFIARDELCWLLTDVVAKGGNLLLNVGPRGVDATIPDEQAERLDWLGQWFGPHQDALVATRPWVRAGTTTTAGDPLRYTTRDDIVFAFVRAADGPVTLPDVAPTPSTTVTTVDGTGVPWHDSAAGLTVDLADRSPGVEPTVIALHHQLVYDDYGDPGSERLLVYVHGLMLDSEINRGIAGALADGGHRVVLIDLLGHGRSDKPTHASEYRIDTYADQVIGLLDHLEVPAAVLGGMSLGANVSLFTASRHPERVRGLVLEMPVLEWAVPTAALLFAPMVLVAHYGRPVVSRLASLLARVPDTPIGPLNSFLHAAALPPDSMAALLHGILVGPVAPTAEERSAIQAPALVLAHRNDLIHPFDDAHNLARLLPHGRLERARSPVELRLRPDRLTDVIAAFLDEVWAGDARVDARAG